MTPKYKTLADLKVAYESGELDAEYSPLILDNDCSYVYVYPDNDYEQEGLCVYRGKGYELRDEALTLAGIPWEHC